MKETLAFMTSSWITTRSRSKLGFRQPLVVTSCKIFIRLKAQGLSNSTKSATLTRTQKAFRRQKQWRYASLRYCSMTRCATSSTFKIWRFSIAISRTRRKMRNCSLQTRAFQKSSLCPRKLSSCFRINCLRLARRAKERRFKLSNSPLASCSYSSPIWLACSI